MRPLISVILPVYNCDQYVQEAVQSILDQTLSDFELLIIDDASTDNTVSKVKELDDDRIILIEKPENTGYTQSLNHGIKISRGKYIARMDGDDICFPDRFEKQVAFLENNADVIVCGTSLKVIGSEEVVKFPLSYSEIKDQMLERTAFAHPSVMMRKQILEDNNLFYDRTKEPAEDFDLWVRLLPYGEFANLPEALLQYRLHQNQVSVTRRQTQVKSKLETRVNIMRHLGIEIHKAGEEILICIFNGSELSIENIMSFQELKKELLVANNDSYFDLITFQQYLDALEKKAIGNYFTRRKRFYPKLLVHYIHFKKDGLFRLNFKREMTFVLKCMVFYSRK